MAPMPSVTLVKSFTYRGAAEEWTNTYHFTGGDPTSDADWKAIADAIVTEEKTLYLSTCSMVRGIGHKAGVAVADWTYDYAANSESVPGTFGSGDGTALSGDTANWLRWATDQLTSKGKPIYLRKYFHPGIAGSTGSRDTTSSVWVSSAGDFGTFMHDFMGDASRAIAGPNGAVGLDPLASASVTTRTLKRRGRRP